MTRDDLPPVADRHGPGHLAVRRHHPRQHRYGHPNATDEQVREAARMSYVDRFVHMLPDGYDTVIERGSKRQRR